MNTILVESTLKHVAVFDEIISLERNEITVRLQYGEYMDAIYLLACTICNIVDTSTGSYVQGWSSIAMSMQPGRVLRNEVFPAHCGPIVMSRGADIAELKWGRRTTTLVMSHRIP